ncbi:hypothetical protein [Mamestra configurata nucleopolyhedrovirus A]|uniref:Maco-A 10 n=1 Tax=Mamestra configurata nucleopolyhedrovirus TaxID=207830 RepID=Q71AK1_NPVMC|nr:hypothetical protein [Mamestra configurata nucleopolyhedrovirus A]
MAASNIPTLLRLCAECIASSPTKYNSLVLNNYQLPTLPINCVMHSGRFEAISFNDLINYRNEECLRVQPTRADVIGACNLDLTLLDNAVYVCTIGNLAGDMMRLDMHSGHYYLRPFSNGYLFAPLDCTVNVNDLAHSFSASNLHRGLSAEMGFKKDSAMMNSWRATLFDDHIGRNLDNNFFSCYYPMYDVCCAYNGLAHSVALLNYIPLLFYLNRPVCSDDLPYLKLTCQTPVSDVNNVCMCFYVYHSVYERLGVAVLQTMFCGAFAQVNVLWSNSYTAVGNFKVCDTSLYGSNVPYVCKFNPCMCDYSYSDFVNKIKQ